MIFIKNKISNIEKRSESSIKREANYLKLTKKSDTFRLFDNFCKP
jgi:hypothetical protein